LATIKTKGTGKKKRWYVRYDGPPNAESGKRKQLQKTFRTSKEAEDFAARVTLDRNFQGVSPLQGMMLSTEKELVQMPFSDFATSWFEGEYYLKVRASTFKTRRFYLEKQLIPYFKDTPIAAILTQDVRDFYVHLKKKGYEPKTISTIHKFLSTLFQSAVEKGCIVKSPLKDMKDKPKDPIRIAHPWNPPEISVFLEVAEREGKEGMYDFTLSTGLRQGEVFALPWFNIDLEQKTVTVTRSVSYDEYGNPELIPKAQSSYRTLSIPPYLVEKLSKHKAKQVEQKKRFGDHYQHDLDLVFPAMNGGFLNPSNVRRQFYGLCKKANVRRITFHDLRHSHACTLIRGGVQPRVVQYRLGHADIETTFRYYGHLWPNADQQAADLLEEMMVKRLKKE
jgi:integrase